MSTTTIIEGKIDFANLRKSRVQGIPEISLAIKKGDNLHYASLSLSPKTVEFGKNKGRSWKDVSIERIQNELGIDKMTADKVDSLVGRKGRIITTTKVNEDDDILTKSRFYFDNETPEGQLSEEETADIFA